MSVNLTRQLTVIMGVFIFLTASAAIIPAYLLIRSELEQQVISRVEDARQHSSLILDFEQIQLESLVTLASERPTLKSLVEQRDWVALDDYLEDFKRNTPLDYLYVLEENNNIVGGSAPTDTELALTNTHSVENFGLITGAIRLDDEFANRLSQQTGFMYHFLPETDVTGSFQRTIDGIRYYGHIRSLEGFANTPSAALEILLPLQGLLAVEGRVVGLLLLTTLAVTIIASFAGGFYIRTRLHPLRQLTSAAQRIGQGDLSTPIQAASKTTEVRALADVLEKSRLHLSRTLSELLAAKEWSESLIRSIVEGIITFDDNGIVTFFSEGATRITQIPEMEAVGQKLNATIPLLSETEGTFSDYIPPQEARRTVKISLRDGQVITVAVTRARERADGQTTIVLRDVTEDIQRRSLQAYFLANVSHEFRTPLAGMKVSIELLLENVRYLSVAEINELLNSLHLSVSSLQSLIDNLLESSKIEANHFTLRRRPAELNHLLGEAVRLVQPFLNRRQQTLTLDEPLSMPVLKLDPTRLTQVLVNLLSNASKYSAMATPIDIQVEMREQSLYIAVLDRGQGIPESQREVIFKQFVRLGAESNADYGSGLGLAVVKAIIEAHSGQVGVDVREGGGSIFWFTLPVEEMV